MAGRELRAHLPCSVQGLLHRLGGPPGRAPPQGRSLVQLGSMMFRDVILADFEFAAPPGERTQPICLVAQSLVSGTIYRLWRDELLQRTEAPYATDDTLFVA